MQLPTKTVLLLLAASAYNLQPYLQTHLLKNKSSFLRGLWTR